MKKYFITTLLLVPVIGFAKCARDFNNCLADTCGEFGAPHVEPGNSFCANEEFHDLAALPTYGGELFWYTDAALTNEVCTGSYCTPQNIIGTTTYYVVAIEEECVSEVETVNVTIYPLPDVQIAPSSPILLYPGDSLYLTSNFEYNNLWTPFSENDSLLITSAGEYVLTVRDENYCYHSDTAFVELIDTTTVHGYHPLLFVPNAFTPDGDGVNDVFTVTTHDIENFELHIFNRWGKLIFETNDALQSWTGGEEYYSPDGQYIYTIKLDTGNQTSFYKGVITIIR